MTTSQASRALRHATSTLSALAVTGALAACSLTSTTGPLADGKYWDSTCPKDGRPIAGFAAIDVSGSNYVKTFGGQTEAVVRDLAARVAVCGGNAGGHLRVVAFWDNRAKPVTLFDDVLSLPGATANARYRKLGDSTDKAVAAIAEAYNKIDANGFEGGTDAVGQLQSAQEFGQALGSSTHLVTVLITDGEQTVSPVSINVKDKASALRAANALPVPKLGGELVVVGLGKTKKWTPGMSQNADNLKAMWTHICERSGTSNCTVATDYTSPVGSGS